MATSGSAGSRSGRRPLLTAAAVAVTSLARTPAARAAPAPGGGGGVDGTGAAGSGPPAGTLTDRALAEVSAYVAGALERYGVPGAAVAVVQRGAVRFARGFGVTQLGGGQAVTPATRFMIGSVPKSMTALMIGTLVDDGLLAWDTPVVAVLPAFALADPAATAAVTFRDLLSMRSGLPRFDTPLFLGPLSPEEVVESLAAVPLHARPGEAYAYSNQGYATAGFAAAVAAGARYGRDVYATFARLMQERLFGPAGMTRTELDFDRGVAGADRAAPHAIDLLTGRRTAAPFDVERGGASVIPAGGTTWASAEDVARYLLLQLRRGVTPGGRRVVSEARLFETRRPHTPLPEGGHFGLGWIVGQYQGLEHLDYTGGNVGYTSYVGLLPAVDLGVVVLTNASLAAPFKQAVAEYVYESALGLEHTADARYLAVEQEIRGALAQIGGLIGPPAEPGQVAALLGRYGTDHGVQVRFDDAGALVLATAFGELPLYPMTGRAGVFLLGVGAGVTVTFAPSEPGGGRLTVDWLLGDPQPPLSLTRVA